MPAYGMVEIDRSIDRANARPGRGADELVAKLERIDDGELIRRVVGGIRFELERLAFRGGDPQVRAEKLRVDEIRSGGALFNL